MDMNIYLKFDECLSTACDSVPTNMWIIRIHLPNGVTKTNRESLHFEPTEQTCPADFRY